MLLKITHNMEVAHRLSRDTTKCKQIHGHGMQVTISFPGLEEGHNGMARTRYGDTVEFGSAKRTFRSYVDSNYDHHLVLNADDDFAGELTFADPSGTEWKTKLPGLTTVPGEPTVENLARWIGEWAARQFRTDVVCSIDETRTNGAEVRVDWIGTTTKVQL